MCTTSWPLLLDLSRDECKRLLRRLELEAYSALISAFRAQGDLNKDKKKLLQELQHVLSISTERHRAEIRRAVNDEKLTTVADHVVGRDVSSEWQVEGRRLVPLMPRLVPQTAFTLAASSLAGIQAERNLTLPSPSLTGNKDGSGSMLGGGGTPGKASQPGSPSGNVVVLPSGKSIHIKGGLHSDDETMEVKKRPRSSSSEGAGVVLTRTTQGSIITSLAPSRHSQTPPNVTMATSAMHGVSPMKVTVTKSPSRSQPTSTVSHSAGQKVLIVSTGGGGGSPGGGDSRPAYSSSSTTIQAGPSSSSSSSSHLYPHQAHPQPHHPQPYPQPQLHPHAHYQHAPRFHHPPLGRGAHHPGAGSSSSGGTTTSTPFSSAATVSMATPTVSATVPTSTLHQPRSSVGLQGATAFGGSGGGTMGLATPGSHGNVVTMAASSAGTSMTGPGIHPYTLGTPRPRVRAMTTRMRTPQYQQPRPSLPSSLGGQPVAPSPGQTVHNIQVKPISKPTIHIKQEGSMKIITQGIPPTTTTTTRILPKTTAGGASQVVMVTTASGAAVSKAGVVGQGGGHVQSGKVLSMPSGGARLIAASTARTPGGASVVTVNPKTLHLTTIKGATVASGGAGGGGGSGVATARIATPTGATKPNVIVVQKAQPKKPGMAGTTTIQVAKTPTSSFEKELVSFIRKQDTQKPAGGSTPQAAGLPRTVIDRRLIRPGVPSGDTTRRHVLVRRPSGGAGQPGLTLQGLPLPGASLQGGPARSSLLADLIHAVGIGGDGVGSVGPGHEVALSEDSQASSTIAAEVALEQQQQQQQQQHPGSQWVQYDVQSAEGANILVQEGAAAVQPGNEAGDASAIRALLDLQAGSVGTHLKARNQPTTLDLSQLPPDIQSQIGEQLGDTSVGSLTPTSTHSQGRRDTSPDIEVISVERGEPLTPPRHSLQMRPQHKVHVVDSTGRTYQMHIANPHQMAMKRHLVVSGAGEPHAVGGVVVTHRGVGVGAGVRGVVEALAPQPPRHHEEDVRVEVIDSSNLRAFAGVLQQGAHAQVLTTSTVAAATQRAPLVPRQILTQIVSASPRGVLDETGAPSPGPEHDQEQVVTSSGLDLGSALDPSSGALGEASSGGVVGLLDPPEEVAPIDFLSSALSEAQVDLDSYQFTEEDPTHHPKPVAEATVTLATVPSPPPPPPPPAPQPQPQRLPSPPVQTHSQEGATIVVEMEAGGSLGDLSVTSSGVGVVVGGHRAAESTTTGVMAIQTLNQGAEVVSEFTASVPSSNVLDTIQQTVTPPPSRPLYGGKRIVTMVTTADQSAAIQSSQSESVIPQYSQSESVIPQYSQSQTTVAPIDESQALLTDTDQSPTAILETDQSESADVLISESEAVVTQDVSRKLSTIHVIRHSTPAAGMPGSLEGASNVAVRTEPAAAALGTTGIQLEDLTSQRLEIEMLPGEDLGQDFSASGSGDDLNQRLSKRKRKAPLSADELTTQSSVGGWIRLGLGLLQRVMRYRGAYKEKGEMNAASWFTRPVDRGEVPDYYDIIKKPMDFGTIKKKLETGHYDDWEAFHADMVQVRDNCMRYNPPGTEVRRDCDEVFAFYLSEYDKLLIRWQQGHLTLSPVSAKKLKLDKSPVR